MLFLSLILAYFVCAALFGITGKQVVPLISSDVDSMSKKDIAIMLLIAVPAILFALFISYILKH